MYLIHLNIEGYELKVANRGKFTLNNTHHIILEYEHINLLELKSILPDIQFEYTILDAGDVYLRNKKY